MEPDLRQGNENDFSIKTLIPAYKTPFLPTTEQSVILRKAWLAHPCDILVPEIPGNDP